MEKTDDSEIRFRSLNNNFFDSDSKDRQENLGRLIESSMVYEHYGKGGKVKIAPAMVLKAYQNVYLDSSSRNFVPDTEKCSVFNYLDAFSTLITQDHKDIMNVWEKNYLSLQILNEELCK